MKRKTTPRLGKEVVTLWRRKAGPLPHRNTRRLRTRADQRRQAIRHGH